MTYDLHGKKVAVLATDGFEEVELTKPLEALRGAGAEALVVSIHDGEITGWNHHERGDAIPVDLTVDEAQPEDFDALMLPGGVMNPDSLRTNTRAVRFVRSFFEAGKPVAAICHGPQMLIEADVVRGRKLTSFPSVKTDLINAGANWVDQPVVTDQGLVTSRKPDDIPQFNAKMLEEIAEGIHAGQHS